MIEVAFRLDGSGVIIGLVAGVATPIPLKEIVKPVGLDSIEVYGHLLRTTTVTFSLLLYTLCPEKNN